MTVYGANAVFTAMLQLGARAALAVGDEISVGSSSFKVGGGVEVGVYADVAIFTTNMTEGNLTGNPACELEIVQDYSVVLSATAGAQVTLGTQKYGPTPNTSTPVYYTTLKSICTNLATSTAALFTTTAVAQKRQDSSQTVTTSIAATEILVVHTMTAIQCPSTITGPCPVSLQTTTTSVQTRTTIISDASDPSNPSPTITAIPFGTNVHSLKDISGVPMTYNPSPIRSAVGGVETQLVQAVNHHKQIALGVGIGVGLGLPVLALIACITL